MRFETIDMSCDVVLRYSGRAGSHQKLHYDERNSVKQIWMGGSRRNPQVAPKKNEL